MLLRSWGDSKTESMMNKKMIATVPKLNNKGGDLSKKWFVYYRIWNERTQKYQGIRVYKGFAELKTKHAKTRFANKLIEELTFKLRNGYSPISEKEAQVIYSDEIEYANIAQKYGRRKKSNKTVNYWANRYFASIADNISKSSYTTYQSKLRVFNEWLKQKNLYKVDISAISPQIAQEFFEYLSNTRKIGNSKALYKEQMLRLFNYVIKHKAIRLNPFIDIEIKNKPAQPPRYFQAKSLEMMRTYMVKNDKQLWLAARFVFYCYIRPKELRLLKIGDILINEGILRISAEISKTKKERNPVIPEKFRQELIDEGLSNYPDNYFVISVKKTPYTKGVSKNYLWYHFDKVRTALGIQREHKFYGFKHTGMIMVKQAGGDSKHIQMQAGHHSLDMVDKYINQMLPVDSEFLRYNGPSI